MLANTPDRLDLTIYQNGAWQETFRFHQGDTDSAVVNLTGYTAALTVKAEPGDTTSLLSLTSSAGLTMGGTAGTITINQSASQINAYTWTRGLYELVVTDGSATPCVVLYGEIQLVQF